MAARGPQRDHRHLEFGTGHQAGRDRVPDAGVGDPGVAHEGDARGQRAAQRVRGLEHPPGDRRAHQLQLVEAGQAGVQVAVEDAGQQPEPVAVQPRLVPGRARLRPTPATRPSTTLTSTGPVKLPPWSRACTPAMKMPAGRASARRASAGRSSAAVGHGWLPSLAGSHGWAGTVCDAWPYCQIPSDRMEWPAKEVPDVPHSPYPAAYPAGSDPAFTLTGGPAGATAATLAALGRPILHHLDPAFGALYQRDRGVAAAGVRDRAEPGHPAG